MDSPNYILSTLILIFFSVYILSFNSLKQTFYLIIKAIYSYKANLAVDERVVSIRERNILVLLSIFSLITFATPILSDFLNTPYLNTLLIITLSISIYAFFKKLMYLFLIWLSNKSTLFKIVESLFLNHIIILTSIITIITITQLWINFLENTTHIKTLAVCILAFYTIYFTRTLITFISHRFSLLFYILYLCIVEIIPIALLIKFFLGHI